MEAVSRERIDMEYGFAQFDRRSRLVGGFVWDIPWGKKSGNWLVKNVLARWQFSGNFSYTSSTPFTIRAQSGTYDWNKDYDSQGRPLWLGGNYQDLITWSARKPTFNKSLFGIPTPPAYAGDLSYYNQNFAERNAFRWFPTYDINLAFQKYFAVPMGGGRDLNIQLIAEVFNVFKWMLWDLTWRQQRWEQTQFGVPQRMSGPRSAQFSVRVLF